MPMHGSAGYVPAGARPATLALVAAVHVAILAAFVLAPPVAVHRLIERRLDLFDVRLTTPPADAPPPRAHTPVPVPAAPEPMVRTPALATIVTMPPPPIAPPPATPAPPVPASPTPPAVVAPEPPREVSRDLAATMLSAPPPRYPVASRRAHEQGVVVLALRLAPDGSVAAISVRRSSGSDRLDDAALAAVRRWRWSPTVVAGQAVAVTGLVHIPFVLR